jgi:hypothetical protein
MPQELASLDPQEWDHQTMQISFVGQQQPKKKIFLEKINGDNKMGLG